MNYQWYPGHMTKARRMIEEDMKLIDLVIEIVDARIPLSGRNPDIDTLSRGKARLILLAKEDLADPRKTAAYLSYFASQGLTAASYDLRKSGISKKIMPCIREACKERIERNARRGIKNRPMRALVAGIPNVGKSTFINSFAGKAVAKTGNKPGVTKGKQWIRMSKEVEFLDSPGILWPKFEDPLVGERLAMIGAISDEVLPAGILASAILRTAAAECPSCLAERYGLSDEVISDAGERRKEKEGEAAEETVLLGEIAKVRGCLKKGGEADGEKAALIVIDEFRKGILGRYTLDEVPKI